MTEALLLYSFRRCPYAMRARMALAVAKVDYEHREVALRDKPAAMLLASPKATVPVLVLGDGRVIDESLDIMRWALAQNDPQNWGTAHDPLIDMIDGRFKHHLDRMKYAHRYEGGDPREHRAVATALLTKIETRLGASPYLGGAAPHFADIAIMPLIRQFARADLSAWENAELPRLRHWLDNLVNTSIFTAIMAKHPLWTDGADRPKDAA